MGTQIKRLAGIGLLLPLAAATAVSAAAKISGDWQGSITTNGTTLKLVFHLKEAGGKVGGTMDSPDQHASGIPITSGSLNGDALAVQVASIGASLQGKVAASGKGIAGTWKQGARLPLALTAAKATGVSGDWQGTITPKNGQGALQVVFHLKESGGKITGSMDSVTQKAMGIALTGTVTGKSAVQLTVAGVGGEYTGHLAGGKLTGEWWQGATIPLELKR